MWSDYILESILDKLAYYCKEYNENFEVFEINYEELEIYFYYKNSDVNCIKFELSEIVYGEEVSYNQIDILKRKMIKYGFKYVENK